MTAKISSPCTAFRAGKRIASGTAAELTRELYADHAGVLVFDDTTGGVVDLDWREAQCSRETAPKVSPTKRTRGRPKLGVTAREVTLLPRHWAWLAAQPGGASQALRRLVEAARNKDGGRTSRRIACERCYRAMAPLAGDLPGFEDASRHLFSERLESFARAIDAWPADIRDYLKSLLIPRDEDLA